MLLLSFVGPTAFGHSKHVEPLPSQTGTPRVTEGRKKDFYILRLIKIIMLHINAHFL